MKVVIYVATIYSQQDENRSFRSGCEQSWLQKFVWDHRL